MKSNRTPKYDGLFLTPISHDRVVGNPDYHVMSLSISKVS